jgi:hypothetical protein
MPHRKHTSTACYVDSSTPYLNFTDIILNGFSLLVIRTRHASVFYAHHLRPVPHRQSTKSVGNIKGMVRSLPYRCANGCRVEVEKKL